MVNKQCFNTFTPIKAKEVKSITKNIVHRIKQGVSRFIFWGGFVVKYPEHFVKPDGAMRM